MKKILLSSLFLFSLPLLSAEAFPSLIIEVGSIKHEANDIEANVYTLSVCNQKEGDNFVKIFYPLPEGRILVTNKDNVGTTFFKAAFTDVTPALFARTLTNGFANSPEYKTMIEALKAYLNPPFNPEHSTTMLMIFDTLVRQSPNLTDLQDMTDHATRIVDLYSLKETS